MAEQKSVVLLSESTCLVGERSCEMEGFCTHTGNFTSSCLPHDELNALPLACIIRCRGLGGAIGDEDVDEARVV